jgi:hypothetical protein
MSRELSNHIDTDEEKSIFMAQDAINRYLGNLLDENNLSSYCYSKFYEISFKELNSFQGNATEIF